MHKIIVSLRYHANVDVTEKKCVSTQQIVSLLLIFYINFFT